MKIEIIAKTHKARIIKSENGALEVEILDAGIPMTNPDREQLAYKSTQMEKAISDVSAYNERMKQIQLSDRKESPTEFQITQKYVSGDDDINEDEEKTIDLL